MEEDGIKAPPYTVGGRPWKWRNCNVGVVGPGDGGCEVAIFGIVI